MILSDAGELIRRCSGTIDCNIIMFNHMQVSISVVGGTNKLVRSNLFINSEMVGSLSMGREDFTRFSELLMSGEYTMTQGSIAFPQEIKEN